MSALVSRENVINLKKSNNKMKKLQNESNNNNNSAQLKKQFDSAVEAIKNLPKNGPFQPSNELLLKFYAYYKQSTLGSCNTSRPSMFKVVDRAKWDAW
jgi:acyl-CoA-binding protein